MRYPTGKDNQDFLNNWKNDQPFGSKTSYGYHEGEDFNIKTGGDSDIGQPLYAVADGKIVYFHNASHPTSGFGKHMVLECETSRGKRWYHYCHCLEMTSEVKEVKEGDIIGKLGKSGTKLAHLHFSVFKVDPKTLTKGIDSIAKTTTELNAWWERFELLTTQGSNTPEKTYTQEEWDKLRAENQDNWDKWKAETLTTAGLKEQLKLAQDKHQSLIEYIITKIAPLRAFIDQSEESAKGAIVELVSLVDTLNKTISDNKKQAEKKEQELVKVNEALQGKLETLQEQFDRMKEKHAQEMDAMQEKIDKVQEKVEENNEKVKENNKFQIWIKELITKILKG